MIVLEEGIILIITLITITLTIAPTITLIITLTIIILTPLLRYPFRYKTKAYKSNPTATPY